MFLDFYISEDKNMDWKSKEIKNNSHGQQDNQSEQYLESIKDNICIYCWQI